MAGPSPDATAPSAEGASLPRVDDRDGVAVVHLGDGENRFTVAWVRRLAELLDEVAAAGAPLVTTGGGRHYSNGLDLDWLRANPPAYQAYLSDVHHLLARLLVLPVPTVAAVQGHAFAAGALLALAHDQRLMREDRGWFCLPEIDLGLPFTPGLDALLGATMLPDVATRAVTTGHRFTGPEALDGRIVREVRPLEQLLDRAVTLAADLRGKDPDVLGQIKQRRFGPVVALLRGG